MSKQAKLYTGWQRRNTDIKPYTGSSRGYFVRDQDTGDLFGLCMFPDPVSREMFQVIAQLTEKAYNAGFEDAQKKEKP